MGNGDSELRIMLVLIIFAPF